MNREDHMGTLLVALQFALLGGLAVWAGFAPGQAPTWDAWITASASVLLGLWAVHANRPGNFNIRPAPRKGGRLVQHGPYRWIRHPMYTAVLLLAYAATRVTDDHRAWLAWLALVTVLLAKAAIEEQAMKAAHPDYAAYCVRTQRFIPGLF